MITVHAIIGDTERRHEGLSSGDKKNKPVMSMSFHDLFEAQSAVAISGCFGFRSRNNRYCSAMTNTGNTSFNPTQNAGLYKQ